MEMNSKYWIRIKTNIEKLFENKVIKENYLYDDFCDDFNPSLKPIKTPISEECLCGHPIKYNYTYTNKYNKDVFILGSCCIETFSTTYKNRRICIDCNDKIKINKENRCSDCRKRNKQNEKKEKERKSKQCKNCLLSKFNLCYNCFIKLKRQSLR
jgi:hypothetical protein